MYNLIRLVNELWNLLSWELTILYVAVTVLVVPVACGVAEKTAAPLRNKSFREEAGLLTIDILNA